MISMNSFIFKSIKCYYSSSIRIALHLVILFSFAQHLSFAQAHKPEEILKKIKNHKKQDTALVNLYVDLSKEFQIGTYENSQFYAEKARELAKTLNYKKGLGNAYYCLGKVYFHVSELDSSRIYYEKALTTFKSIKYRVKYSDCLNSIGTTHYVNSNFDEALKFFNESIIANHAYNKTENANCLSNIGSIYGAKGKTEKAIHYFNEALRVEHKNGNSEKFDLAYNNLGITYDSKGDWAKALHYYQKANKIQKKTGKLSEMSVSYRNMGRIYYYEKDYQKALNYIQKSIEIAERYNIKHHLIESLKLNGIIYHELKDFSKSVQIQKRALQIGREIDSKQSISGSLNYLGVSYMELDSLDRAMACFNEALEINTEIGLSHAISSNFKWISKIYVIRKQWNEAIKYAKKANESAIKNSHLDSQYRANGLLAEIYEKIGNYKDAFIHYKEYTKFKDSLYNQKSTRKLAQLEYEYMYADSLERSLKRELTLSNQVKQTKLESAESAKFNLGLTVALLSIVLITVLIIAFLIIKNTRTKFKNIDIEQKLLRTQMTPHFLFNSMGIIQGMILNGAYQKSLDYLNDFSKLLRLTLENSRNKTVSLEKELEAINSYVSLQNNTSHEPYNCEIHLDSSTDPKKILLPPMLIQPFVENAIEHGFEEEMIDKNIDITIQFNDGDLVCVITDNGVGINQTISKKTETKTSMATEITKDRLKLLAAEFKVRTGFSIKDRTIFSEKGTVVNLILLHKRIVNG